MSSKDEKMVSVIIPTYNRAKTLEKSVDSVLKQTYKNIEVIIVDDGSSDNTKYVVDRILDSRIRYVYQSNAGACAARNNGIEKAKGDFIAFQDSDDVWHEEKIEKQMKIIQSQNVEVVFCKLNKIENGRIKEILPSALGEGIVNPVNNLFGIGTQTLLFKKEVLEKLRFDIRMPRFQEFELLLNIVENGYTLYCIDDGLVDYYIGEDSISRNYTKLLCACERIRSKHPNFSSDYPQMKTIMVCVLNDAARVLCNNGDKSFILYLKEAAKIDGGIKEKIKVLLAKLNLYRHFIK